MGIVAIAFGAVLLAFVTAHLARRRRPVTRASRQPRLQSETTGVPIEAIEDYGSRRLARGSVAPSTMTSQLASSASLSSLVIRPLLRPVTPRRPLDDRWDLTDRDHDPRDT